VPRPTPHHRRKAGSGPPAAALIAWIGTDPRWGSAAATRERRHDRRAPANFRSARNVVASVALVCGAVLAVTVSTTQAVLGPHEATTPPVSSQEHQAEPPVSAQQADPKPMVSPIPAAAQPAPARQAPQSLSVLPAPKHVAQTATPAPLEQAAAPAAVPHAGTQPDALAQRRTTTKSDVTPRSGATQGSRSGQRSPSAREERSGLGSTLDRTTGFLGSTLGLR
jgi:hypothetical protein